MESPLPEQLFLDIPVADVLNKTARTRLVEPWASRYCTAISEKRYGDAIYARYHIDGRAKDGIYTDLRDKGDGPFEIHETSVYDMILEDARELAQTCPDLYSDALLFYRESIPNDSRRDIIEGLFKIGSAGPATELPGNRKCCG
ncbi:hypothetical protein BO82DRAFT_358568 [Aspergillus uvarum CBS 121591]|uniref:Uncharacterized protein n=1 Tax=Aspergillus uvarum CBS 121591 TaxID=1448315 RepID=A0A319CES4_9EURO|nr:hypothetical protein BO82DRAFT_358568 [Aspergillus uvarum CBS 121591]PYH77033.1 hypothetical protein BO82DRAFT_358568 [Aspergillus uvarum CBS 121591]